MDIKINLWLQDDLESFIKEKLLNDWFEENDIHGHNRHDFWLCNLDGGYYEDPPNPNYGKFTWRIKKMGDRHTRYGTVEISIRDALKRYLSNEE